MNMPAVQIKSFAADGGWNRETPPLRLKPGVLRDALNFECNISGGYSLISGYERYDGRTSPSSAVYYTVPATVTGSWTLGDTVNGLVSGATGKVIAQSNTGLVVTKVTGTFQAGEVLQISGSNVATCTAANYVGGAPSLKLDAQYIALAANQYRADIGLVPGSGSVLGVWIYQDVVYAFRNNVGGTAAEMFKSSGTGWQAVTLYNEISFSNGNTATPADGATLTQGGVTATVKRVVTQSGAWSGTAAGRFIITNPTGGNFAAGAATLSGGATVSLNGVQTAITLAPNGRYEFCNSNFGGALGSKRMYGCDGVNRSFEFDGTVFVPIVTGMSSDTPSHVFEHLNYLFLSFGPSVQNSALGNPYSWSPILGASEMNAGDTVTAFKQLQGGTSNPALLVSTRGMLKILYGTGPSSWSLIPYATESGAIANTVQRVGQAMMLSDRGISLMSQTQAFGNFEQATITQNIRSWLALEKTKASASMICREKNQYRLFFNDGYGLYCTMNGELLVGLTPVQFPTPIACACSGDFSDGTERKFIGTTDGYVHQLDSGTSFDGVAINFLLNFAWFNAGGARILKRWRNCAIEIQGTSYAEFQVGYNIGYQDADIVQPNDQTVVSNLSVALWDVFVWDTVNFDGITLSPSRVPLEGTAENISIAVRGSSDYMQPFSVTGATFQYSTRRRIR